MPSLNYLNIAIPDVYIRVGSIDQPHADKADTTIVSALISLFGQTARLLDHFTHYP